MNTFNKLVKIILEDNIAGAGGVFGDAPSMGHGGDVGNSDFYAPGDARVPYTIGTFRRSGILKKKKKSKKRIKKSARRHKYKKK